MKTGNGIDAERSAAKRRSTPLYIQSNNNADPLTTSTYLAAGIIAGGTSRFRTQGRADQRAPAGAATRRRERADLNRTTKWLAAALLAPLMLMGGAATVVATLDWNRLRPALGEQISAALGRPVSIDGALAVNWGRDAGLAGWRGWLPGLQVDAAQLRIGNPAWAADPELARFGQVSFRLDLLPLLRRQVRIARITVSRPEAWLERRADGRVTWQLDQDDEPESRHWTLDIGEIAFDQGRLRLNDAMHALTLDATITPLTTAFSFDDIIGPREGEADTGSAAPPYAFGWQASGRLRGQAFAGEGKLGGLLALHGGGQPFPLQADIRAGRTRIAVAGTLVDPRELAALDLHLNLSGANVADLHALTGLPLPDTPPYSTRGRLVAQLHETGGARFHYRDFSGRIGRSDIRGTLSYTATSPRPLLSGELHSRLLRLDDLGPLIGASGPAAVKPPAGRVLPATPFRTERWRRMDADLRLVGEQIERPDALPLNGLQTHLQLSDGQLSLAPLQLGMAGGALQGELRLDGRSSPLRGEVKMKAQRLDLKQLLPGVEPMQTSLGELHGEIALAGHGSSVAALLGSADGDLRLVLGRGQISRGLMEIAGLNLGNYIIGKLFGDETVKINCALADFGVQDGLARSRLALFDTDNARVDIAGTVNFASERLDLEIHPQSRGMRLFSLRSPLYVRGSFARPEAGVQPGPLIARGAGMLALGAAVAPIAGLLALVAPSGDDASPCAALLRQAQGGTRR